MRTLIKFPRPTWVYGLSNKDLLDRFGAAEDARGPEEDQNVHRLLNLLADEISRREREGTLTDKDWLKGPLE